MNHEQLQAIVNYIRGEGIDQAASYLKTFEYNARVEGLRAGAEAMRELIAADMSDDLAEHIRAMPLPEME